MFTLYMQAARVNRLALTLPSPAERERGKAGGGEGSRVVERQHAMGRIEVKILRAT